MPTHGDIDPDVKIPAAVKKAAAKADEVHKKTYSKNEPEADPPADPGNDPKDPEPPNPEAPPAETAQDPALTPPTKEPAKQPEPPAQVEVTPEGNQPDEDWEHKYKSMKGRFDRQDEQLKAALSRIQQLEHQLSSTLKTPPAPDPTPVVEAKPQPLLSEQEIEDYGPEFLAVVGKKAKDELSPELAALRKMMEDVTSRLDSVGGSLEQTSRATMENTLDEKCPNWREINQNQDFIAWLQLPDNYSGAIRHELLKEAYQRHDTQRVLAFFKGFLAEEAALAPAEPTPGLEPDPPEDNGKVPLENFAAPGRAKTAAAGNDAPAEKPIISRAQIASFYAAVAAGKYRGKDTEKQRLEQMIFEAERDGRIR